MSKVAILQVGPCPAWDEEPLNLKFNVHRYFEVPDKQAFLKSNSRQIRVIETSGEPGANRATIEALPAFRIASDRNRAMKAQIEFGPAARACCVFRRFE